MNEFYSRDLSDKIKKVKMFQMKKGYTLWYPAYGYKKTPEDKHKIVIDDEAAKIVKRIFSMKQDGKGCTEIARILNNEGIPSPGKYRKIGNGSEDRFWRKNSVYNIIKNEVYTGATVCHKSQTVYISGVGTKKVKTQKTERIIVPNTHDAIIDKETFKNVNDGIKVRTKTKKSERNLLSGKIKCRSCGRPGSSWGPACRIVKTRTEGGNKRSGGGGQGGCRKENEKKVKKGIDKRGKAW